MIHFVILLLVFAGVAWYFMTPAERARVARALLQAGQTGVRTTVRIIALDAPGCDEFMTELRARTGRVFVTPALIAASIVVFILMVFAPGPISSIGTLVSWGGNFPPRTIYFEWWRLVTALFIHARALDLLVNAVCLFQLGLLVERLAGPLAFTTVYAASGVAAGIVSVSSSPDDVSVGAAAAIIGIYGLLTATSIWSTIWPSPLTLPREILKRLAPVAAVFVLYRVMTGGLVHAPEMAALATGVLGGVLIAQEMNDRKPQMRRMATAMATMVVFSTMCAVAMHRRILEVTDARPAIELAIAAEQRTTRAYDEGVVDFKKGRMTAIALSGLIDQRIVPPLRAAAGRLAALQEVPPDQQPLVATAQEFLKLRSESWRLRAAALRKADMQGLRQADASEQASLAVFRRVKPARRNAGG